MHRSLRRGGFVLLVAGFVLSRLAASELISVHNRDPRDLELLFAAFDRGSNERTPIWASHEWAIEIVRMEADGKLIEPAEIVIVHGSPNLSEVVVQPGGQFVFRVPRDELVFHRSGDRYLKFSLEGVPDRIRVTYRVRYPSGAASDPMVSESILGVPRDEAESFLNRGRSAVVPAQLPDKKK